MYFVSEEKKIETGIDDSTKSIADKIADLMGLKRCSL
jgi:antitoxin component of RelBE/YafQ-DinJ toxin-antitoxin module